MVNCLFRIFPSAVPIPTGFDLPCQRYNTVMRRAVPLDADSRRFNVLKSHQQRHPAGQLTLYLAGGGRDTMGYPIRQHQLVQRHAVGIVLKEYVVFDVRLSH